MGKAARAIIIENGKLLLMHRNKYGSEYFTLVGGRVHDGETLEQALVREVKEETGLTVTAATLMFVEEYKAPHNEQYTYLCEVAPHQGAAIQSDSEEGFLNKLDANIHKLVWTDIPAFKNIQFRTPHLQKAIAAGLKNGWPKKPVKL